MRGIRYALCLHLRARRWRGRRHRRSPDSQSLDESLIVLFPARSPAYPDDTLEDVLHHEVAHVLMGRAARGAPLPLWFHEGLAVLAERTWRLEDQARLLRELLLVSRTPLDRVDALFAADAGSRARAYTLAAAFVRDLIRRHGGDAPANILRRSGAASPSNARSCR